MVGPRQEGGSVVSALTKLEYQKLHAHLGRLLPPGGRPLTAEEVVDVGDLRERVASVISELRPVVEKGERVLAWRIPRDQAPTLNVFAYMKGWQKKKRCRALDEALRAILPSFPKALLHGSEARRWVRVTRFSTQRVDDLSIDVLGGKLPVDSLVRCGVLHDDDDAHMIREALWLKCKRGETSVLVEVFEATTEGAPVAEPTHERIAQVVHEPGFFTRALMEAK